MGFIKICSLVIFSLSLTVAQEDGTVVQLEKGKIQGRIRESENGTYYAFQEIPYAAPPTGSRRFQLPQEPEAWDGVLNTTKNTKVCYQAALRSDTMDLELTEDCLYLNVYTPIKPGSTDLLPVYVWIHGGSFTSESGVYDYYGPKYLIDQGLVVVALNYRLGPFGFVGTDDGVIPLNLGLKDQRLAIEWVHKNIKLFGGDPDKVTLGGESAGAVAVGYQIINQKPEEELFQAAIQESGSTVSGILKGSDPNSVALNLAQAVNSTFTSTNSTDILEVLQLAEAEDILNSAITGAVFVESDGLYSSLGYQAFIDGTYKKIPVLTGFNSEEWLLFLLAYDVDNTTLEQIDENPSALILSNINMSSENKSIAGELYKEVYVGNGTFKGNLGAYVRYASDVYFTTGISKQVELGCVDAPYYFYQFSYKGDLGQNVVPPPEGCEKVQHAEELYYYWDFGINSNLSQYSEKDQLTARRLINLWTNFIKYSNPTPESDPLLNNLTWSVTDPTNLTYLNINNTLELRQSPRNYHQLKPILETYMEPPFDTFS